MKRSMLQRLNMFTCLYHSTENDHLIQMTALGILHSRVMAEHWGGGGGGIPKDASAYQQSDVKH